MFWLRIMAIRKNSLKKSKQMPITSTARVGGETPGDADQMALANLLSKIGISAQSTLSVSEEETANND